MTMIPSFRGRSRATIVGGSRVRRGLGACLLLSLVLLAIGAGACARRKDKTIVPTEPVARRDITVTVEATGTVEPIDLVEVKSKASGLIVKMPVDVGTTVEQGQLMVQIDTRDV